MNLGRGGGEEGRLNEREEGERGKGGEEGRGKRERREGARSEEESMSTCKHTVSKNVEGGLTWNHSPLGRAGLIHAAKKMPVTARMGQAMVMKMP